MSPWLPALGAGLAVWLWSRPSATRPRRPTAGVDPAVPADESGWLRRHRLLWSVLAGVGAATFLQGPAGLVAAPIAAVGVWVVIGRAEPPDQRRRREAIRRDLPHVVGLLAAGLRTGTSLVETLDVVCRALPGAAADRLEGVCARLRLGTPPSEVWAEVAADAELGALGRTLARAQTTGAPVVAAVEALAADLASEARAEVEDRARAVGVKAAVPLGLCLLPAFLLIGIVPLVAGLAGSLGW